MSDYRLKGGFKMGMCDDLKCGRRGEDCVCTVYAPDSVAMRERHGHCVIGSPVIKEVEMKKRAGQQKTRRKK